MRRQLVDVLHQIAEGDTGPVVSALRLQRVPLDFVAERVDALAAALTALHPIEAGPVEYLGLKIFRKL